MKKYLISLVIFLASFFCIIGNAKAETVSYTYNDIEYNFDINSIAESFGYEATGNYVLTTGSNYFTSGSEIENFYIMIELKDSILTLEPNSEDIDTNEIVNNTFYFANVSSTTLKESDIITLEVKYNLASEEYSIARNTSGGVGFRGILRTNMPYFYSRTDGKLVDTKKFTILRQLIYDYDKLEYITYNFENGERFIFPKLKDYYFVSSTSYDKFGVTYSDSPAIYNTETNTVKYDSTALHINYYNETIGSTPYEAFEVKTGNNFTYKYDYTFSNYKIYDQNGNLAHLPRGQYTYENLIDTSLINKIEFNFTIPTDNKSFDLELLTTFSDYYLSKPYLQITDTFDNVTISEIDDFLGERTKSEATDINGNEIYQYSGSFGIDFLDIKEVKLIFDVSNYVDDLYINFTSSFDYEVNYINSIDEVEYYKRIMMDNKYGLYLIPTTINSDNFSNINLNGTYNIEVRNNYTGNNEYTVLKTLENYTEPNFQYVFKFNEYNYLIYFENTKYNTEEDDTYYITFDTRYYNYSIKELIFDEPIISNPNTGEEIKLPSNDSIEQLPQDMNSFIKYIEKVFDGDTIKEIFNNIYQLFKKTRLGIYLFIIIGSSLILLWIKSMK